MKNKKAILPCSARLASALPPGQVVRTTLRGGTPGAAPEVTAANVPPIVLAPTAASQIGFSARS